MGALWHWLTGPLDSPPMRRALIEALILSVPAGMLGAWVVLRRLAFTSHAVGNATFPAVVIAYLAGWSVSGASTAAAVALAVALVLLSRRSELAEGAVVAVALAFLLALGAVLVSDVRDPGVGTEGLLFGSLLALDPSDLARGAAVAAVVALCGAAAGRGWLAIGFDPASARAAGWPILRLDALLAALLGLAVGVSVTLVGSLMAAGLFVIPAATARLVTRRLPPLQAAGVGFAVLDGVIGLWLSGRLDLPAGAAIVATGAGLFLLVLAVRRGATWLIARPAPVEA
jgi:manganese/iron transport system permease protein